MGLLPRIQGMKTLWRCLTLAALSPLLAHARPAAEDLRIEHLLTTVKTLQGATFVRSGKDYSGPDAEAHLRMKLEKAGERVQSAEDFITGIASKSILTGKPYQIRFPDGKLTNSGPFLSTKLKELKP